MDLFGDLPTPAGKKSPGNGNADDLFGGLPAAASSSSTAHCETNEQKKIGKESTDAKTSAATAEESSATVSSDKRKSAASLVSAVGKAGTSLAFVPQAISHARKKKKFLPQQQQPTLKKVEPKTVNVEVLQQSRVDAKENEESKDTEMLNGHQSLHTSRTGNSTTAQPALRREPDSTDTNNNEQTDEEPYQENEPESIRLLHASVSPSNAYNPHFPNDYLAHLERKKTERIQKELQQSALQRLDQQEKLRKKIEEERRKIENSGDVNRIVEMHTGLVGGNLIGGAGRGRGRGRGAQNLPAWLVKKQQEQQRAAEQSSSSSNAPIVQGQFGDAEDDNAADENCAITLFDVVAPGEIDEHLETEIREECEEQSLKVVDIKIFDASSTCQFVRVDISFADGAAARDAARLFNGRKFGERHITAKIME